jgi:hypothetical protein
LAIAQSSATIESAANAVAQDWNLVDGDAQLALAQHDESLPQKTLVDTAGV